MDYLEREAFGGYTWLQVGLATLAILLLLRVVAWIRKPRYNDPNLIAVRCGCGWRGKVGKYNPVCPKCSARLG